jgi:ABC-type antimicrobial peptide transport system permease subunit
MFYVRYLLSELRRRRGRTILTALGLGVGVGLVVTASALSSGLDDAQAKVLKPLTGVGTDLSVSRSLRLPDRGSGPRFRLQGIGKPGTRFSRDSFVPGPQQTFSSRRVQQIAALAGVRAAAGGLTLNSIHISGKLPKATTGQFGAAAPQSINANTLTVSGVDQRYPQLGALTSGQLSRGRYFSASNTKREAIVNYSYARRTGIKLGGTIKLGGKTFTVIGFAKTPLGGQASDVYIKLSQLQALSGRKGLVNTIYVRATSADQVDKVAAEIKSQFKGASVTTASDLAKRISGSLVDAKNLTNKLGTALELVGLVAAFLIASLLTLSSVTKRVRELGTLKALGWRQALVVRQVTGESLAQGLLGGVVGVALGVGGALLITALSPTLKATVAQAANALPRGGGPVTFGTFGQGAVNGGSTTVALSAPVSIGLIALAVALAIVGGLLSGAVGGLRAARLRPAEALRSVE